MLLDILGGAGLALAPRLDQGGEALALGCDLLHFRADVALFGGDALAQPHEFGEIGAENFDLLPEIGHDGAEQHRGAYGFENILGAYQHGRGRAPADALQRGQNLGDQVAPAVERAANRGLAGLQEAEPRLQRAEPLLAGLRPGGGFEESLVESGTIGADARHFLLEGGAGVGVSGETLLDRLELALARLLLDKLLHRLALEGFRIRLGRLGKGGSTERGYQQSGEAQAAQSGANQQRGHTR
ncbi:hypothetical protein [Bosea robiniae]|uniref:hypothetical protein n=1 Tax=Bosea robiniae TaxID=1036780 RepID=UPI001FCDB81A|nr:hypothetical protein [Bosea robiniae]